MLNIPNTLSILRILMVPLYMIMMYSNITYANQIAFVLFAIAAMTDYLDGHIARKYKLVTDFGKIIDPVADKIMVTAAMIVLVDQHKLAAWIVVMMLFRDFSVGALRDVAASKGQIIAAGIWGKAKTVLQIVAIGFMMFYDSITIWPISAIGFNLSVITVGSHVVIPCYQIGSILIYLALAVSIWSGILYFIQFRKVFDE